MDGEMTPAIGPTAWCSWHGASEMPSPACKFRLGLGRVGGQAARTAWRRSTRRAAVRRPGPSRSAARRAGTVPAAGRARRRPAPRRPAAPGWPASWLPRRRRPRAAADRPARWPGRRSGRRNIPAIAAVRASTGGWPEVDSGHVDGLGPERVGQQVDAGRDHRRRPGEQVGHRVSLPGAGSLARQQIRWPRPSATAAAARAAAALEANTAAPAATRSAACRSRCCGSPRVPMRAITTAAGRRRRAGRCSDRRRQSRRRVGLGTVAEDDVQQQHPDVRIGGLGGQQVQAQRRVDHRVWPAAGERVVAQVDHRVTGPGQLRSAELRLGKRQVGAQRDVRSQVADDRAGDQHGLVRQGAAGVQTAQRRQGRRPVAARSDPRTASPGPARRARPARSPPPSVRSGSPGPSSTVVTGVRASDPAARTRSATVGSGGLESTTMWPVSGSSSSMASARSALRPPTGADRSRPPTPSTWETPTPASSSRQDSCWAPVPEAATMPTFGRPVGLRRRGQYVRESEPDPGDDGGAAVRAHHQQPGILGALLEQDLVLDRHVVGEHHDVTAGVEGVQCFAEHGQGRARTTGPARRPGRPRQRSARYRRRRGEGAATGRAVGCRAAAMATSTAATPAWTASSSSPRTAISSSVGAASGISKPSPRVSSTLSSVAIATCAAVTPGVPATAWVIRSRVTESWYSPRRSRTCSVTGPLSSEQA